MSEASKSPPAERKLLLVVAAMQFVNILDFMMVMPLGPDFAKQWAIPTSSLGIVGGSYTAAACISGVVGSFFLDRFPRKKAATWAMVGLGLGTLSGAFAVGFHSLIAARIFAGMFGGPASSLAVSIVADQVPVERRGKAMSTVMGAFAIASVFGVPVGLELARRGGVRAPFAVVGCLALVMALVARRFLPDPTSSSASEPSAAEPKATLGTLLQNRLVPLSWLTTSVALMSGFILIPNIAAYVQKNLLFPRAHLPVLYLAGGGMSIVSATFSGRLVDRLGSFVMVTIGVACVVLATYAGFAAWPGLLPVPGIFMAYMFSMSVRNVAYTTLATQVPRPFERARFMSIQSAIQHGSSATGAFFSTRILSHEPSGALIGMRKVAFLSMGLMSLLPVLVFLLQKKLRARDEASTDETELKPVQQPTSL